MFLLSLFTTYMSNVITESKVQSYYQLPFLLHLEVNLHQMYQMMVQRAMLITFHKSMSLTILKTVTLIVGVVALCRVLQLPQSESESSNLFNVAKKATP